MADLQSFAEMNNMELNSDKCKDMIADFLKFNSSVLQPISPWSSALSHLYK